MNTNHFRGWEEENSQFQNFESPYTMYNKHILNFNLLHINFQYFCNEF